jgi:hypothetical protein
MNLRYRDVIAAKNDTCEPVPNNLVTANWIARKIVALCDSICRAGRRGLRAAHPCAGVGRPISADLVAHFFTFVFLIFFPVFFFSFSSLVFCFFNFFL